MTEFADILYHDLGKSVVMMQLWTDETTVQSIRWEAVQDDVLRTRRGDSGVLNAVQVWNQMRSVHGWADFIASDLGKKLNRLMDELNGYFEVLQGDCTLSVLADVERICREIHGVTKEFRDDARA